MRVCPAGGHRFTPTGVGTMRCPPAVEANPTVHPHGRGDNASANVYNGIVSGSPPRAWGQLRGAMVRARSTRFTPTGVGTIA